MYGFQLNYSLDLDHYNALDKEVNSASSNLFAFVVDRHLMLAAEMNAILCHLDRQRSLVDDLLESVAERAMNLHRASDNAASDVGMRNLPFTNYLLSILKIADSGF